MAPAIELAARGFVLDQSDAEFLAEGAEDFRKDAPASAAYLRERAARTSAGERLVQKDLARMLRIVAKDGVSGFYNGEPARLIVAGSKQGGGILSMADFAHYRAVERKPLECDYRGYHVIAAPPPSSGGVVECETLNLLAGWPTDPTGFHSAQAVHYLTEALRRAFRDRNLTLGRSGLRARRCRAPDFARVCRDAARRNQSGQGDAFGYAVGSWRRRPRAAARRIFRWWMPRAMPSR